VKATHFNALAKKGGEKPRVGGGLGEPRGNLQGLEVPERGDIQLARVREALKNLQEREIRRENIASEGNKSPSALTVNQKAKKKKRAGFGKRHGRGSSKSCSAQKMSTEKNQIICPTGAGKIALGGALGTKGHGNITGSGIRGARGGLARERGSRMVQKKERG